MTALHTGAKKPYLDKIQPETPNFNRKPEDICAFFQKNMPAAFLRNTAEISSKQNISKKKLKSAKKQPEND